MGEEVTPYYQDSAVTIYHGDCREILPELIIIDSVITDPPYGVGEKYVSYDDTFDGWKDLMSWFIPTAISCSKDAVVIPTSKFEGELFIARNFNPDWRVCWFKGASDTRCPIGWKDFELAYIWQKKQRSRAHDHFYANASSTRLGDHPCPKPIDWALWFVSRFSIEWQTVVDPFMGTGTTLLASKTLFRKAIGIEIEERYCEIAAKRMAQEVLPL
jgi:site-specific DNA-methyltransferase (adenine-specific)